MERTFTSEEIRELLAELDPIRKDNWRHGHRDTYVFELDAMHWQTTIEVHHEDGWQTQGGVVAHRVYPRITLEKAWSSNPLAHDTEVKNLKAAIRAITVDAPDDQPNGPAEALIEPISKAILVGDCASLRVMWPEFLEHLADDVGALRRAADAAFGEDFSKPEKGGS